MNNNTLGTYIWIGVMLVLLIILRTADGGMDTLIAQVDSLLLSATTTATDTIDGASAPAVPLLAMWPMLVVGALLAVGWNMRKSGDGGGGIGTRKYLAVECQLWAKDLDA